MKIINVDNIMAWTALTRPSQKILKTGSIVLHRNPAKE